MNRTALLLLLVAALLLGGCASAFPRREVRQSASVVDYLYPRAESPPQAEQGIVTLRPPVRVGIAFVPSPPRAGGLPEPEKARLLDRLKASFQQHDFIGRIDVIPSAYLQPQGGFANLQQTARMFDVDVVALVSHDQVRFNDSNSLAVLYWTIVGAYIIHGDEYDVHTLVDVSVFDVASRRLLFRAPGSSQVKGSASLANYGERTRAAQAEGYSKAVEQVIPRLESELGNFKARVRTDTGLRVENRAGYRGGGSADGIALVLALAATLAIPALRRSR
jgi:rhombotail lipoprotein